MEFNTVSVIGLGYIGLPTASLLAQHSVHVLGVDVCQNVVDSVNAGKLHIVEPELDVLLREVVKKGYLRAATRPEPADAFLIAVPTPLADSYKPDVSCIREVSDSLAPVLSKGNLIILESTSPVGTTELLAQWLAKARPDLTFPQQAGDDADIQITYCPERVLPGKMLHELVVNDRVIGGMSATASHMATQLYGIFVRGNMAVTNVRTAELCKLTENSFRDVNIAFANELSLICDKLDVNVWELIQLANRHPRVNILQPGCGVGGHCIAVDPWFIVDGAPEEAVLIRTAREVNNAKPQWVLRKVREAINRTLARSPQMVLEDIHVACLGLAFKPDIDDLRESPAIAITRDIAALGCQVMVVEQNINALPESLRQSNIRLHSLGDVLSKADVICVMVRHTPFVMAKDRLSHHEELIDAAGILA